MRFWAISVLVSILVIFIVFGCNSVKKVELSQVSAPARAEIEKLTAGGEIRMIEKETSNGRIIYDVEAYVNGKDVEYDIADNGEVLTSEESIPYETLPSAVKQAAEKYFGSSEDLSASTGLEKDHKYYEVEGKKNGEAMSISLDDTGKILEEEKD